MSGKKTAKVLNQLPSTTIGDKRLKRHRELKQLKSVEAQLKQLKQAKDTLDEIIKLDNEIKQNAEKDAIKAIEAQIRDEQLYGPATGRQELTTMMGVVKQYAVEEALEKKYMEELQEEVNLSEKRIVKLNKKITQDIINIENSLDGFSFHLDQGQLEKMGIIEKMDLLQSALIYIKELEDEKETINEDLTVVEQEDYLSDEDRVETLSDEDITAIHKALLLLEKKESKYNKAPNEPLNEEIEKLRAKLGDPNLILQIKNTNHKLATASIELHEKLFSIDLRGTEAVVKKLVTTSKEQIKLCKTNLTKALGLLFEKQLNYLSKCSKLDSIIGEAKDNRDTRINNANVGIDKINTLRKKELERQKAMQDVMVGAIFAGVSVAIPGTGAFATTGQTFILNFVKGEAIKVGKKITSDAIKEKEGLVGKISTNQQKVSESVTIGGLAKGEKYKIFANAAKQIQDCLGIVGSVEAYLAQVEAEETYDSIHPSKLKDIVKDTQKTTTSIHNYVSSIPEIALSTSDSSKKEIEKILWAEFFAAETKNRMNHNWDEFDDANVHTPTENAIKSKYSAFVEFLSNLHTEFGINPSFGRLKGSTIDKNWSILRHEYKLVWPAYNEWGKNYNVTEFWQQILA